MNHSNIPSPHNDLLIEKTWNAQTCEGAPCTLRQCPRSKGLVGLCSDQLQRQLHQINSIERKSRPGLLSYESEESRNLIRSITAPRMRTHFTTLNSITTNRVCRASCGNNLNCKAANAHAHQSTNPASFLILDTKIINQKPHLASSTIPYTKTITL